MSVSSESFAGGAGEHRPTNSFPGRRPLLLGLVLPLTLLQLGLLCLVVFGVLDGPYISAEIRRVAGEDSCYWTCSLQGHQPVEEHVADVPGADFAADMARAEPCLLSIQGVQLGPASLVTEPAYLDGKEALRSWFRDQAALYSVLRGQEKARVVLRGEPGSEARNAEMPVERGSVTSQLVPVLPILVTAVAWLLVGSLVYLRRSHQPLARMLYYFCHGVSVCILVSAANSAATLAMAPWLALLLYKLNIVGMAVVAVAFLNLVVVFPAPQFSIGTTRLLKVSLHAVMGLALILELAGVVFKAVLSLEMFILAISLLLMVRAFLRVEG